MSTDSDVRRKTAAIIAVRSVPRDAQALRRLATDIEQTARALRARADILDEHANDIAVGLGVVLP